MASRKKGKPDHKRLTRIRMSRRRQVVAMLYLSGNHTEKSIAEELKAYGLGCNPATVSHDLTFLKRQWMDAATQTTQQWQVRELSKLAFLEEVLLNHFMRGELEADRYATTMGRMLKRRSELLGLDAPRQVVITPHDPEKVSLLSDDELERILATIYEVEGIPTATATTRPKAQGQLVDHVDQA